MKKIILSLIIAFSFSFSQDEIKYEDLINIKWQMKRYVIDGLSLPIERKRKNDYLGNIYRMVNLLCCTLKRQTYISLPESLN